MDFVGWIILGVIVAFVLTVVVAGIQHERRKAALWDEYYHPPDSEVAEDEQR